MVEQSKTPAQARRGKVAWQYSTSFLKFRVMGPPLRIQLLDDITQLLRAIFSLSLSAGEVSVPIADSG